MLVGLFNVVKVESVPLNFDEYRKSGTVHGANSAHALQPAPELAALPAGVDATTRLGTGPVVATTPA